MAPVDLVVVDETPSEIMTEPVSGVIKGVVVISAFGLPLPDVISIPFTYNFLVVVLSPILTSLSKSYSLEFLKTVLDSCVLTILKSLFLSINIATGKAV